MVSPHTLKHDFLFKNTQNEKQNKRLNKLEANDLLDLSISGLYFLNPDVCMLKNECYKSPIFF